MRPPIFITGVPRSGTSMTAGILARCGAFCGETFGPNQFNRKGMFENMEIREKIVKPYMMLNGADPKGQYPLPVLDSLLSLTNLRERIEGIMVAQGYKDGPWFYKCAKLCLIWPIFQYAFPDATYIVVRREDKDIIHSCLRTAFMNGYKTPAGWQGWIDVHKERFAQMKTAGMRCVEVWPTKFVQGDFSEIRALVKEFGLEWNDKAVEGFVSPELWNGGKTDGQSHNC